MARACFPLRFWTLLVSLLFVSPTRGADDPAYPKGYSRQEHDRRTFELIVPEMAPKDGRFSLLLLVSVNGRDDLARQFEVLAEDGFVVCAPKSRFLGIKGAGENWAANEGPELAALVEHLAATLPIDEERLHVLGLKDWAGFLPLVAFAKTARFRSVCFVESVYRGGSVPSRAKKETGILVIGKGPLDEVPADQRIEPYLRKRVHTSEYRHGEAVPNAYLRYWLGVMEGRFVPGRDRSLDWVEPVPAAEDLLPAAKSAGRACLLYFYSPDDANKPEAKALQNVVFFDPAVRAAAAKVVAYKLAREAQAAAFEALGLTSTPAVVVLDKSGSAVATLDGKIRAKTLARALLKAAR